MGLKITKLKQRKPVYDITVENNENFFANKILVHNCSEIFLTTETERTAVCCLSSVNLGRYHEWSHKGVVADLVRFLDNVLQFFIDNAPDALEKARYSAMRERSIGIGAMGFHSLLQYRGIPFESENARTLNIDIFRKLKSEALGATRILAAERDEAPDMEGSGRRNAHLFAIAPNANSSTITGASPSVEPFKANAFVHRTRAGSHLVKNPYLERVLEEYGKNTEKVWSDIITNRGSVQHLAFLSDAERNVFKTAIEIDQKWVVTHAADRQLYICQGQSINLFFPPGASRKYIHNTHMLAWVAGLKSLYYLRTESSSRAENITEKIERDRLEEFNDIMESEECTACQG